MSWTAELTAIDKKGSLILPTVVFTNDQSGESITRVLQADDIDADRLAEHCEKIIVSLEARDTALPTLKLGKITLPRDKKP